MRGMKLIESVAFSKSSWNPVFGQIFGHQNAVEGAENEARNPKINRGQDTHPLKVNARYVINGTNSIF